MGDEKKDYILGCDPDELARLERQHRIWETHTRQLWQRAGFRQHRRMLDLGCGPGYSTMGLADVMDDPETLTAIDASQAFGDHLMGQLPAGSPVQFVQGDVQRLDLQAGFYDAAFARWLFCFLQRPEVVIEQVHRVLRPGGDLVILDYFNYMSVRLQPWTPALEKGFRAIHQSLAGSGGSLDIGDVLPGMLTHAGFEIVDMMPISEIALPGSPVWVWFDLFRQNFFPGLVKGGYLTAEENAAFERDFEAHGKRPDSYFFAPPMLGIIARKR